MHGGSTGLRGRRSKASREETAGWVRLRRDGRELWDFRAVPRLSRPLRRCARRCRRWSDRLLVAGTGLAEGLADCSGSSWKAWVEVGRASGSVAVRCSRKGLAEDRDGVRSGGHDVSIRNSVGRVRGISPRRKRSTMTSRPPQQGQAAADASVSGVGSGSATVCANAGASSVRIRATLAARQPLAKRP